MGGKLSRLLTATNTATTTTTTSNLNTKKDLQVPGTIMNKSDGEVSKGEQDCHSSEKSKCEAEQVPGGHNTKSSMDASKKRRKTKDLFLKRSKKVMGGGGHKRGVSMDEGGGGSGSEVPAEGPALQSPCVCTLYRRTSDDGLASSSTGGNSSSSSSSTVRAAGNAASTMSSTSGVATVPPTSGSVVPSMFTTSAIIDLTKFNPADYPIDDEDEKARIARAREMEEGISLDDLSLRERDSFPVHSQVDFFHYLVPDLLEITGCSFYWGKIDRYEAERLLEGRPEGTFLLRDSAQEEYLFSVSFRRYGRSLHARIEQWNNHFSFDSHDPSVYSSKTVTGLIGHYKDPSCCMFFEPMLTTPLHRSNVFPLLHLARAAATKHLKYDDINGLPLPKAMKRYLKEYHYKQRVCIRRLE